MYSIDRYRIPETSPGRRFPDDRMSAGGRPLPPDPRDSVRPAPRDRRSLEGDRRSLEGDRRGLEGDRRGLENDRRGLVIDRRERNEFGRRSQEFDYNHGYDQPVRRDLERSRLENEGKRKMAEELELREQQLAITSNLLQKQSEMLKNMEANMVRNQRVNPPGPGPMLGRNMGPPGPNMGPPLDMRPEARSVRRNPEWSPGVGLHKFGRALERDRFDDPPLKRFKEIEPNDRSNWNRAVQARGGKTRTVGRTQGGLVIERICRICKSPNHVAKFCPKSKTKVSDNGPSIDKVCNICQSPNHFARDCHTKVKEFDNGNVCNICKSPNHFKRNCPQKSPKNLVSGQKHIDGRPTGGFNKSVGASRFAGTREARRTFKSEQYRKRFGGVANTKTCKSCSKFNITDFDSHVRTAEHIRLLEQCRAGCKLCNKKRYNSKPQHDKHQVSTLHKALVGKKKLVVEAKLKPFSPTQTSGVEYVVPVSGYFCKLCKKFYNKEAYAKDDHCKSKAHYDKVASLIGSKFETAIGARFQEIKDKLSAEVKDQKQLERKLIEAVRKADFVTNLKPIPAFKKIVAIKAPASTEATTETEKPAESTEGTEEQAVKTEKDDKTQETQETEASEETSEEKPAEDDGDHEHPDDLEMEVLDDAGGDEAAAE